MAAPSMAGSLSNAWAGIGDFLSGAVEATKEVLIARAGPPRPAAAAPSQAAPGQGGGALDFRTVAIGVAVIAAGVWLARKVT